MALLTTSIRSMLEKISGKMMLAMLFSRLNRDAFPDISIPLASWACLILVKSACTSGT